MTKNKIVFRINDSEYMLLEADNLEEMHCCYDICITFVDDKHSYIVEDGNAREALERFMDKLDKALNKELVLPESLTKDLGYLANESFFSDMADEQNNKVDIWGYYIFGTRGRARSNSWLYNDEQGNIIFEATPSYPWLLNQEANKEPDYIPYEDWIKAYKPYFIKQIPHAVAMRWLKQVEPIVNKIEENVRKEFEGSKTE